MSVTDKMKKLRAAKTAPVKLGQWHEDFSTVKKYADANGVPILAVWSNGDACGHCVMFEQCLLDSKFKTWAKTSGVAMWIGFGTDKSKEDKFEGTGFVFARKGTLTRYPFVRIYWKKGKVDVCKSGGDLTGDTAKGAAKLVKALTKALKSYKPATTTATTTTTTTGGGCEGSCEIPVPEADPVLGYVANADGKTFSLTVDGKVATALTEATAKKVCDRFAASK